MQEGCVYAAQGCVFVAGLHICSGAAFLQQGCVYAADLRICSRATYMQRRAAYMQRRAAYMQQGCVYVAGLQQADGHGFFPTTFSQDRANIRIEWLGILNEKTKFGIGARRSRSLEFSHRLGKTPVGWEKP